MEEGTIIIRILLCEDVTVRLINLLSGAAD